jgi:hypothetical protein
MNPVQTESILKKQIENWPRALAAGKQGNPYATLCMHCYGRHKPPMDEICPNDPPEPRPQSNTPEK